MSKIALDWAETVGYKCSVEYYEYLAIAIMVEAYGIKRTAQKIKQSQKYVEDSIEAYKIASMPYLRIEKKEYIRMLKKLFERMLNDKEAQKERTLIVLSEKVNMPVVALRELLK